MERQYHGNYVNPYGHSGHYPGQGYHKATEDSIQVKVIIMVKEDIIQDMAIIMVKEDIIQDMAIIMAKEDFIQAMVTIIATEVCIIDNYYNITLTLV